MTDEDFVRCSNCGNLNIKGSTKCLFCEEELEVAEEDKGKKIETFSCPSCSTELPVSAASCPICGWSKDSVIEEEEGPTDRGESLGIPQAKEVLESPKVPTIPGTEEGIEEEKSEISPALPDIPMEEELKVEEVRVEEDTKKEGVSAKFTLLFITISVAISLLHYGLSFVVALPTIKVIDPEIQVIPLEGDLSAAIKINAAAFYLSFIIAVIVGYFVSVIIRMRINESKSIILFLGIFVFIDLVIHIAFPAIYTVIFYPREILFINLAGATLLFLVSNIILMFTPFIIGGYWAFTRIDKLYFPKKYVQS